MPEFRFHLDPPSINFIGFGYQDSCFLRDYEFFDFLIFWKSRQLNFLKDKNIFFSILPLFKTLFINLSIILLVVSIVIFIWIISTSILIIWIFLGIWYFIVILISITPTKIHWYDFWFIILIYFNYSQYHSVDFPLPIFAICPNQYNGMILNSNSLIYI